MVKKKLAQANPPILFLTTAGSYPQARKLAKQFLAQRVASCINIIPQAESWYRWKGKVEKSKEWLLLIKTTQNRLKALSGTLTQHHSYELPEQMALPVTWVEAGYLKWLRSSLESS